MNSYIVDFIKNVANKSIPRSSAHKTKRHVSWWSDTLANMIKYSLIRHLHRLNKRCLKLRNNSIPYALHNVYIISVWIGVFYTCSRISLNNW